jgi:hypothetical protein
LKSQKIVLYPFIKDINLLNDVLNRTIWAFPPSSGFNIFYSSEKEFTTDNISSQYNYLTKIKDARSNSLYRVDYKVLKSLLNEASLILIYDKKYRYNLLLKGLISRVKIIDPFYFSLEESNITKFGLYNCLDEFTKNIFRELSMQNYKEFKLKNKTKTNSYIFVTGPSFTKYKELLYEDNSLKIVCNTIVKDDDFLNFIGGPDIICFADPAFHFSTNLYAHEFRNLVFNCVKKYNSYIAVPQACVPLMCYHYPEIKNYVIGLRYSSTPIIPSDVNLSVKPTGSVLTFLMLPLAISLTEKVNIIGADGRQKGESYFWKHNTKVQLSSLMEYVYETHPSFFRDRSYANHYKHHCNEVKEMIDLGESHGSVIKVKTPSYVPCLNDRYEE